MHLTIFIARYRRRASKEYILLRPLADFYMASVFAEGSELVLLGFTAGVTVREDIGRCVIKVHVGEDFLMF